MDKLSREEVLHVAKLARLRLKDSEIDTYSIKLKEILNEIEKINEVDVDCDIMISPTINKCSLREKDLLEEKKPPEFCS